MNKAPQWMTMADPIHGVIRLKRHNRNHQLLLDVMNSRAFQRLRRIRQMGLAEFVFPGATHSRFVHSIGSAWLMIKTLDYLEEYEDIRTLLRSNYADTDVSLEQVLLLSILVHDIGHTPLSHTLEDILDLKSQGLLHDAYWNRLILTEDPELQAIWQRYNPQLPKAVSGFNGWDETQTPHFLSDLVSSQLDMDRLDYLLRDSHYLGVQYGRIEVDRIITNLTIGNMANGKPAVAIREEAIAAVEHYLFGRYQAYKMALHSLDKASETLLKKTLERFRYARDNNINPGHPADLLYQLMCDGHQLKVEDFLMLDDCYLWDKISLWGRDSQDPLLKTLANRMLGHDLFKYTEINLEVDQDIDALLEPIKAGMSTYYKGRGLSLEFGFEAMEVFPKALYQTAPYKSPIWIKSRNGQLHDFADVSSLAVCATPTPQHRCLLFVWDSDAKKHLSKLIQEHLN